MTQINSSSKINPPPLRQSQELGLSQVNVSTTQGADEFSGIPVKIPDDSIDLAKLRIQEKSSTDEEGTRYEYLISGDHDGKRDLELFHINSDKKLSDEQIRKSLKAVVELIRAADQFRSRRSDPSKGIRVNNDLMERSSFELIFEDNELMAVAMKRLDHVVDAEHAPAKPKDTPITGKGDKEPEAYEFENYHYYVYDLESAQIRQLAKDQPSYFMRMGHSTNQMNANEIMGLDKDVKNDKGERKFDSAGEIMLRQGEDFVEKLLKPLAQEF